MIHYIGNDLFNEYVSSTIEEAYSYLKEQEIIGFDIETTRKYKKGTYREDFYKPGLDPYLSNIIMFQIGTLERQYVIDARCTDLTPLMDILTDNNITKVIHNAQFECKHILHNYGVRIVNIWDTMVIEKVLYNGLNLSNSLEALMKRYLDVHSMSEKDLFNQDIEEEEIEDSYDVFNLIDGKLKEKEYVDKSIRTQFVEWGAKPFTPKQIEYGARDITAPIEIREIQLKGRKIGNEHWYPELGIKLENNYVFILAEMSYNGVPFRADKWIALEKINQQKRLQRLEALDNYIIKNEPKYSTAIDLFTSLPTCQIKWNSSTEIVKLYRHWGICPKEKSKQTKKVEWTVGAKALYKTLSSTHKKMFLDDEFPKEIISKDDFTVAYLLYKKSEQLTTTFGLEYLEAVHPITKRIHPGYNQYMISGRLSSVNKNIQQIPRSKEFRECFETEHQFICDDYSSQEIYTAGIVHNSDPIKDFFKYENEWKGDFHCFAATKMFRIVYNDPTFVCTKEHKERGIAKNMSFKIIFGGSPYTIKEEMGIELSEAESFVDGWLDGFEVRESFKTKMKEAFERGWIELDPYTKKRYFFPQFQKMMDLKKEGDSFFPEDYRSYSKEQKEIWKEEYKKINPRYSEVWSEFMTLKGKLERRGLNLCVQGLCSSMTKLGGIYVCNYVWKNNLQKAFKSTIACHDELVYESTDGNGQTYGLVVEDGMSKASTFFLKELTIPAHPLLTNYWSK